MLRLEILSSKPMTGERNLNYYIFAMRVVCLQPIKFNLWLNVHLFVSFASLEIAPLRDKREGVGSFLEKLI